MRIVLPNSWFIEDEVYGYSIYQESVNEKGNKVQKYNAFPTTLERCVEIISRTNVSNEVIGDISILDYVKTMKEEFTKNMNEVNKYIKGE